MYDSARLCFEILERCTNVVSVTLQAENWDVLPVISETICLARLEVLTLCARHLTPFLQRFDLPMLKSLSLSLSLHHQSRAPTPPPTPLILFLIRSPNLEHLSTNCLLAENTPDVLQHTPSLISLYFRENPVDDAFFAALRYSDTDSVHLVPKLETLELVLVGEEFEESSFAEMLRSRWWSDDELFVMPTPPAVARLKHVAFWREARPLSPEFDQALDMYMAQGLELDGF
ncbi:hypothetical protein DFH09DRAFT_1487439 [Mycena vulgaris]|nr:hypothetical protein DFH09DRAFT_1487439 [Mycena vulgaris]